LELSLKSIKLTLLTNMGKKLNCQDNSINYTEGKKLD